MTLLSICQSALEEIGAVDVPASFFGNVSDTAVQTRALANRVLRDLVTHKNGKPIPWPEMTKEYTFITSNALAEYEMPDDFGNIIPNTVWDRTNDFQMVGGIGPVEWQRLQTSDVTLETRKYFRMAQGPVSERLRFMIFPTPTTSGDTIAFDYQTKYPALTTAGVLQERFSADTDTALIDEDLITLGIKWRFKQAKGLPYAEELSDYELAVSNRLGVALLPSAVNVTDGVRQLRVFSTKDTGFGGV